MAPLSDKVGAGTDVVIGRGWVRQKTRYLLVLEEGGCQGKTGPGRPLSSSD